MLNPYLITLLLVVLLCGIHGTATALRAVRSRRHSRRRIVEKPNSHYDSPVARKVETRHRWHDLALERMHEINRAEVIRLLARAEAAGADALRPSEQIFLDRMAELAGRR